MTEPSPMVADAAAVVGLDEAPNESVEDLARQLGGKGANLAIMRGRLALPVPPAFVITTGVHREFRKTGWTNDHDAAIVAALHRIEGATGRRLGDAARPLLLSVRSSGVVSMPGMMDTVLNVGINPRTFEGLAKMLGGRNFALDTRRRFCRMYAKTVLGFSDEKLGLEAADASSEVERLCALADAHGTRIPDDPWAQLTSTIKGVFASWDNERAQVFRRQEGIPGELGTAVIVQAMVFGNANPQSGTGVAFTRDPATGHRVPCGDFLPCAQGEDVVAGTHRTMPLVRMGEFLPEAFVELLGALDRLERHYRDLCDVEFTVEDSRLWILQTRIGRRSPAAAVRIAVDMAEDPEFPFTRHEAVTRVSSDEINRLRSRNSIMSHAIPIGGGIAASPGVAAGIVCRDPERAVDLAAEGVSVIFVRLTTSPDDVAGMIAAAGILTGVGGMMSHAAVVARGWGIPAVTGTDVMSVTDRGILIGDRALDDGQMITIDGGTGKIYAGDQRTMQTGELPELATLTRWTAELGIDVGRAETAEPVNGDQALPPLTVLRALQLKGTASVHSLADLLLVPVLVVERVIDNLPTDYLTRVSRGLQITENGRQWLDLQLAEERSGFDRNLLETMFREFAGLDAAFKRTVAAWQIRSPGGERQANDLLDARSDASVIGELGQLHNAVQPLVDTLAEQAFRFSGFGRRLDRAYRRLLLGDRSMFASPLKDSYHTIWFELHEEFIQLTGRTRRAVEEASRELST